MEKPKILHIMLSAGETSCPYNELALPLAWEQDIAICTYFRSPVTVPENILRVEGGNSLAGFFRGLRAAFSGRDFDVVHVHSVHVGFLFLIFSLFCGKTIRAMKVFTVHTSYENLKFRNRLMLMPVFMCFEKVIFCSEASQRSFPSYLLKLAGKKTRVVRNGVNLTRINSGQRRLKVARGNPKFRVVNVGFCKRLKNRDVVLNAFKGSCGPEDDLVLIGEVPRECDFLKNLEKLRLKEQVLLTGPVSRDSVFEYLSGANLFISASRIEGLPVSVLEAMACGCPVVLSDIPPHREITGGADFIPLVHPDDVDGFSREIRRIKKMTCSERAQLGEKCKKLAEEKFSLDAMLEGYKNIYKEAVIR